DIEQGLRVDSRQLLNNPYQFPISAAASPMCRFPNIDSATASIASTASTHHHNSALSSRVEVPAADPEEALAALPEPIPVFFHNSTVSGGITEKSDSRRSGFTAASSSRP